MSDSRPDRRPARSRRRLKEALLALIQERGYDKITVGDITNRADVGRSTFYAHFTSKDDLLFSGFDKWVRSLADFSTPGMSPSAAFRFSRPMLDHVRTQRKFFRAMMVDAADRAIRRRVTALLAEVIVRELDRLADHRDGRRIRAAEARCVVGAWLGIVTWWLESAPGLGADTIDAVFQRTVGGLRHRGG